MKEGAETFDVIIIGGGPAGMMAAIKAGESGAKAALVEKNGSLGSKLLLTGGKRSNIAKAEYDNKELAKKYGKEGGFLIYPLSVFGAKETIRFFEEKGLKTKIEEDSRVFPESDRAEDVLDVLKKSLKDSGVSVMTGCKIKKVARENNRISRVVLEDGRELRAERYVLCTGGMAFPQTGSSGDGYKWAEESGHTIERLKPALVPVKIKESWVKEVQGLSLKDIRLNIFQKNKKKESAIGDVVFTHFGLSGPIVLNMSRRIGELLESGEVKIVLDLNPDLSIESLDKKMQSYFSKNINKVFKNCLLGLLPPKIAPAIISMSGVSGLKKVNEITKEERHRLARLLKEMEMTVSSVLSFKEALVTSGGVSLKEIDSKTMKSKLIENLYFAGEVINLHGPTGGYNLQLCWSTGYLAGQSVAKSR